MLKRVKALVFKNLEIKFSRQTVKTLLLLLLPLLWLLVTYVQTVEALQSIITYPKSHS